MERRVTGTCIDYTHDGRGVIKIDQMPIFVHNVLMGEKVDILITRKAQGYYEGRVLLRHNDSPERTTPPCPYFEACGGCQLQHMSYQEQLRMKKGRVAEVLRRTGNYNGPIQPIVGMPNPYHYRNKIQMPFGMTHEGELIAGLYKFGTHHIIDIEECLIENAEADAIIKTLKKLFQSYHIEPFDVKSKKGWIRYALIRKGAKTGQVMVVLIVGKDIFPKIDQIVNALLKAHPSITTIIQNVNTQDTNVVMGEKETILHGKGYIEDMLQGLRFKISSKSFFQVNPEQTERLYDLAINLAKLTPSDTVLDAYCGVGTIALIAAKKARHVFGVDIVEDAIQNAIENTRINQITNASFITSDATPFMLEQAKQGKTYDVLFVDPPRNGCTPSFLHAIIQMKPKRMVYISCEPSSLARDLKILSSVYDVKHVQPVDMFSQTYHVETITLLSLKQK